MGDDDQRAPGRGQPLHAGRRLDGEIGIAGAEDFVHHEHFGGDGRGRRKHQPRLHAKRVRLEGLLQELAELGELDHVFGGAFHLAAFQAIVGERRPDVLQARELGMEAETHAHQCLHASPDIDRAPGRVGHAGDDLQQRRLAGAVAPDDPQARAGPNFQVDTLQRLEFFVPAPASHARQSDRIENLGQPAVVKPVRLRDSREEDGRLRHCRGRSVSPA